LTGLTGGGVNVVDGAYGDDGAAWNRGSDRLRRGRSWRRRKRSRRSRSCGGNRGSGSGLLRGRIVWLRSF